MGMFDYYEPSERFSCSTCGEPLRDRWQGKDGINALLVWREGQAAPIGYAEAVPPESRIDEEPIASWRLPGEFDITAWCEAGHERMRWADVVVTSGLRQFLMAS